MAAPSNSLFRIVGAMGLHIDPTDPSTQETITQGIGFPLRPIDGIPSTTSLGIPAEAIATGLPVQFMPNGWEEGKYFPEGSLVTNGIFEMVAQTLTLEYPFPEPSGTPEYSIPAFTPSTESEAAEVFSGHVWAFNQAVFVQRIRVWPPAVGLTINYRIRVAIGYPGQPTLIVRTYLAPSLTAGQWNPVVALNQAFPSGTLLQVVLDATNFAATTPVTGRWFYEGEDKIGAPTPGGWNNTKDFATIRISDTDLDGVDRTTELLLMVTGTTINFASVNNPAQQRVFRVTGEVTAGTGFVEFPAVLETVVGGGFPTDTETLMDAEIPIYAGTEYSEEAGVPTPTWANVTGILAFNGALQPSGATNTYGVDIQVDPAVIPDDWQILSYIPLT